MHSRSDNIDNSLKKSKIFEEELFNSNGTVKHFSEYHVVMKQYPCTSDHVCMSRLFTGGAYLSCTLYDSMSFKRVIGAISEI